ncbi:MAG: hypothetical protein EA370_08985 [Wenzhouxiangella sp.]|nr:MAG: hypothetical protein EA370_08985 [Wenzhouxiangella sp.]
MTASIWFFLPQIYSGLPLDRPDRAVTMSGLKFQPLVGRGFFRDAESVGIREFDRGEAVLGSDAFFDASNLSTVRLDLAGVHPDSQVALLWQTLSPSAEVHLVELHRGAAEVTWHRLDLEPDWDGQIAQVAIGVYGLHSVEPIRLRSLDFQPPTREILARFLWQDWRLFQPWRQGSANHYSGTPAETPLRPVTVMIIWLVTALVLLMIFIHWRRLAAAVWMPSALVVVLVPWLVLDGLWQARLSDQVASTRARFGGLDQAGKRGMEDDALLQAQAREVLDHLEPLRGQRLFILRESMRHEFNRLRLQYHLLPLNVYNFGHQLPEPGHARAGDYVLLLDDPGGVEFYSEDEVLVDERFRWPATLSLEQPRFLVFRLEGPGEEAF